MAEPRTSAGANIAFRGVHRHYGPVQALRSFSLEVAAGEFVTLLGPSGSGKTTALNSLAGFIEPSGGEILLDGVPVTRLPTEKRGVGMVFQSYSLFPHMTVLDNVAFPLRMRGLDRRSRHARAAEALALVQLPDIGARMPTALSGGQRQRVALARAVVFEPKVLLMDEPLGALDLKLREAMQFEIKRLQRRIGCTVLYVTHDQGEALTMSDRIVVMRDGAIEQVGTPEAVYDRPATRFVAEFIGETNILAAQGDAGTVTLGQGLLRFAAPDGFAGAWRGQASLRPERILRAGLPQAGALHLPAEITEAVFLGDMVRYLARLPDGQSIVFHEHRSLGQPPQAEGAAVTLAFHPEHAVLLQDRDTASI
jgi:putative spermidine/putrescine transport system ATP-binding protein